MSSQAPIDLCSRCKLLALDPSSTRTGYALLDMADGAIIDAGLLLPTKQKAEAIYRVGDMLDELDVLMGSNSLEVAVIEMPLGKQYSRQRGKRSGLAVWAGAAWAMWALIRTEDPNLPLLPVGIAWTRSTTKRMRQAEVISRASSYDPARDPGMDVSDAVSLGWWYLAQRRAVNAATFAIDRKRPRVEIRIERTET